MAGIHDGHRKRITQKLESDALLPHEVLEILLFNLMPRKNTNDIAHRLLARFGSMDGVFEACMSELQEVEGVGEVLARSLYCFGLINRKYLSHRERKAYEGKFDPGQFLSYVKAEYGKENCEVLDLYLLNRNGEVFKRHRFTNGERSSVTLNTKDLSKILLEETPSGIVLVHNHLDGGAVASRADEEMTRSCQIVCNLHDVLLCDHIIYAGEGVYSYYLSGELQKISRSYSLNGISNNLND